jgi:hypothetical protein
MVGMLMKNAVELSGRFPVKKIHLPYGAFVIKRKHRSDSGVALGFGEFGWLCALASLCFLKIQIKFGIGVCCLLCLLT